MNNHSQCRENPTYYKTMESQLNFNSNNRQVTPALSTSNSSITSEAGHDVEDPEILESCSWGSRISRKMIKLQLLSTASFVWFGLTMYGSDFPVKVQLSKGLITLFFPCVYSVGLAVTYRALYTRSSFGIWAASLLQVITIISSSLFQYLCFKFHDEYCTGSWATITLGLLMLINGLVTVTAAGIVYQGFLKFIL